MKTIIDSLIYLVISRKIKTIGARQGVCPPDTFTLTNHSDEGIDVVEACERIAQHFSSISKEYPSIKNCTLPTRVQDKLNLPNIANDVQIVEEYEVFEMLKKRKLKNNSVPGDIPTKLKKSFCLK